MTSRSGAFTAMATLILAAGAMTTGATARVGRGYGAVDGPGWGERGDFRDRDRDREASSGPAGEGRVSVSRFVAQAPASEALGHGTITVSAQSSGGDTMMGADRATFEAAMVDQLVSAGYDTMQKHPDGGQLAELTVSRNVLVPAELKRNPVSGTAAMEVGSRGSGYGLGINIDLTKPLPALISTKLEARIRDRATGTVLWEGRAEIATREGDARWSEQAIAARLSAALLDEFPRASDGIAQPG